MTTPNHNTPFQWGKGPQQINTRREFAEVVRDVTGIDTWYPVRYDFGDLIIAEFKITCRWQYDRQKYGFWWELKGHSGQKEYHLCEKLIISDYWTACIRLCEYLGCTQKEINDIFWGGKDRSEVGCQGCPCNRVEGKGGMR